MISIIDILIYAIMISYINYVPNHGQIHPDTCTSGIEKVFWSLFVSTRGATNRVKIISLLSNRPSNPNQISKNIKIDYKSASHHLKTLEDNNLVERFQGGGITTFFVSPLFEGNQQIFDEIVSMV